MALAMPTILSGLGDALAAPLSYACVLSDDDLEASHAGGPAVLRVEVALGSRVCSVLYLTPAHVAHLEEALVGAGYTVVVAP